MRIYVAVAAVLALSAGGTKQKQSPPASQAQPKVVTVPAMIDHNRVIIDVSVPTSKGTTESVRAWIDTGNPELLESEHVAEVNGHGGPCSGTICSPDGLSGVVVGDVDISLDGVKNTGSPLGPDANRAKSTLIPGVDAEMNLPSSVLRHYDLLIDFPGRKVTIGTPGSIHFNGIPARVQINPETGVITVPSKIENKKYDLELDLGSPMSSLSADLFGTLAAAHPDWPHMTGAVGPVNVGGVNGKVMRLDRLQFGPLFLTNVAVVPLAKDRMEIQGKIDPVAGAGLVGVETLQNYRVGIDYAHSILYFDLGRTYTFPDFDVVGLILSAEWDGGFTILGIADFDGKPSVPTGPEGVQPGDHLIAVDGIPVRGSTMGQVWKMLGGTPGQERKLTIERAGKQMEITAAVQHFLGEVPESEGKKKR